MNKSMQAIGGKILEYTATTAEINQWLNSRQAYQRAIEKVVSSPRGFLALWPDDVVCVFNGQPVTRADILNGKRRRQRIHLKSKLACRLERVKPCFVWVFFCEGIGG